MVWSVRGASGTTLGSPASAGAARRFGEGPLCVLVLDRRGERPVEDGRVEARLREAGMDARVLRIDGPETLEEDLREHAPDVLVAAQDDRGDDWRRVLAAMQRLSPHTPVVLIADGEAGEREAIDAVREGAADVIEAGSLRRLPAALLRAVREARRVLRLEQAREELRRSGERYRAFVRNSSEAIWCFEARRPVPLSLPEDQMIDWFYAHGYLAECNDTMARIHGFGAPEDMVGLPLDRILPRHEPKNIEYLRAFIRSGFRLVDSESIELDREGRPMHILNNLIGVTEGERGFRAWGTSRDITPQKRAEARLRDRLEEQQRVYRLSEAVSRARDLPELHEIALDALERGLGADRASVLLLDEKDVMRFEAWRGLSEQYRAAVEGHSPWPPDDPDPQPILVSDVRTEPSIERTLKRTIRREGIRAMAFIPLVFESRLLGRFMVYFDRPHQFSEDEVRMAQTVANHIAFAAEAKRTEAAVREHEEQLRLITDGVPALISYVDTECRYRRVNRTYEKWMGRPLEEIRGRTMREVLGEELWSVVGPHVRKALAGEPAQVEAHVQYGVCPRWVEANYTPDFAASGEVCGVVVLVQDITERKRWEEELARHRDHLEDLVSERTRELEASHQQLRHAERMALIGTLAAGLGHDMGNLLLPLRTRLDVMEAKGLPQDFQEDVKAIRRSAEYLERLSSGLRLLALDPQEKRHETDEHCELGKWWYDVEPMIKNAVPQGVTLQAAFGPDLPPVAMARHALTQVVFNLVQNAGDALRRGPQSRLNAIGVPSQGTGSVRLSAEAAEAGRVRLRVEDNGPGMAEDVKRRCLEPFFTTKTRGISTGFGLALVSGLMQKVGGLLTIDSAPGRGTRCTLDLPAAIGEAEPPRRPHALVTLGDQRLRTFVSSVFRAAGFHVEHEPASSGSQESTVCVWVADRAALEGSAGDGDSAGGVRRFLDHALERRLLVLGSAPATAAPADRRGPQSRANPNRSQSRLGTPLSAIGVPSQQNRVVELGEHPTSAELWRAARAVAESCGVRRKPKTRESPGTTSDEK